MAKPADDVDAELFGRGCGLYRHLDLPFAGWPAGLSLRRRGALSAGGAASRSWGPTYTVFERRPSLRT